MMSMNTRLLLAASIVLALFLSLTGLALDNAFQRSIRGAVEERLQTQIYLLLGASEPGAESGFTMSPRLPESRYATPGSGLYARVVDGEQNSLWESQSLLGLAIPFLPAGQPGVMHFDEFSIDQDGYFLMSFRVEWELAPGQQRVLTYQVAENTDTYDAQVSAFRRSLSTWLLVAVVILLAVQGMILRWSLGPLRQLAHEIREIEEGRAQSVSGSYPAELAILTRNLNGLIHNSQQHLRRYRDALGDLAHSIKTPLAVIRSRMQGEDGQEADRTLADQVARIDQVVTYQLQKAAASGRSALATRVPIEPQLSRILNSLDKVYARKGLKLEMELQEGVSFNGDEGDLMEILGNLTDNACKWAASMVMVKASYTERSDGTDLLIRIEDDGPGIPEDLQHTVLQRGGRLDSQVEGQGIGLAVVRDLVEDLYQGELAFETREGGGTVVRVQVPASVSTG